MTENNNALTLDKADSYFIEKMGVSPHDLKIIKNQIAPGITNGDLAYCLNVARSNELDPIKKEIYFVPRRAKITNSQGREEWVNKYEPMVGRTGARLIARRKGLYAPVMVKSEIKEVPVLNPKGEFELKKDLVSIASLPVASLNIPENKIQVLKEFYPGGLISVQANFSEYAQTKKDGGLTQFWQTKPVEMLEKVAEFKLLKQVFGLDGVESYEAGFVSESEGFSKGDIIESEKSIVDDMED